MVKPIKQAGSGISKYPWVNDKLDIACGIAIIVFIFMLAAMYLFWMCKEG